MWIIPELGPMETRQDSKLDRFFDGQTKSQSLVRESIQNSLDAQIDSSKPVKIAFRFGQIDFEKLKNYLNGLNNDLIIHLKACGKSLNDGKTNYLVIEDFNTEGLSGPIDNMEFDEEGNPVSGNFIGFWWSEGLSDKRRGSGGSHGVGKIKLSTSSNLNCFLALTNRNDDKKELVIGYCQLKYHSVNRKQFKGYARYGKLIDSNRIFPYDSKEPDDEIIFNQLKRDFDLKRNHETGLSVVIPGVYEDINFENIIRSLLSEFYLPIMTGALIVEVHDNTNSITIDSNSLMKVVVKYLDQKEINVVEGASKMLEIKKTRMIYTVPGTDLGTVRGRGIESKDFHEDDMKKLQYRFGQGEMVGICIPVVIKEKNDEGIREIRSRFYVFIQNDETSELKHQANYIRDRLLIGKEGTSLGKPFSLAFVYIDDTDLSEFLKHAEDPGHERWIYNTLLEKDIYAEDTPLRLIKHSLNDFYNVLAGIEEDETVENILPDIFNITESGTSDDRGGGTSPTPTPDIKTISQSPFVIFKKQNGFGVKNSKYVSELLESELIQIPFQLSIQTGYASIVGDGVSKYNPMDYDLSNSEIFQIDTENAEVTHIKDNTIVATIIDKEFTIEVRGFDSNRDLEIKGKLIMK